MSEKPIILIDEDTEARRPLAELLRSAGYAVIEIPSAVMPPIIVSGDHERPPGSADSALAEPSHVAGQRRRKSRLSGDGHASKAEKEIDGLNFDFEELRERLDGDGILTKRERVVLMEILKGHSSKTAARTLGISPRTVEFHRANVMQKFRAKNTAELVRIILKRR